MKPINVLYIDDDRALLRFVEEILGAMGMIIWPAETSADADAVLTREPVDVIICDIMLGDENGLDYCRKLRKAGMEKPILMLSANIDIEKPGNEIASGYMGKPFDLVKLRDKIFSLAGQTTTS